MSSAKSTKLVIDFGDAYEPLRQEAFDAHVSMSEVVRQAVRARLQVRTTPNLPQMLADLGWPYGPEAAVEDK